MQPRIVVVMGMRPLTLNELELPLADEIEPLEGEVQRLTPTIDALYVPDIDESLDEQSAAALLVLVPGLGDWYDKLPPY